MSNPEDIPQDVWDAAAKPSLLMMGAVSAKTIEALDVIQRHFQRTIARAILAAIEAEREACAQVADRAAKQNDDSANSLPCDHYKIPFRLHRKHASLDIAAAIRNRAQP